MLKLSKEQVEEAFMDLAQNDLDGAISLATGMFVSLLKHKIKINDGNPDLTINVNGMGQRDITIHALEK